MRSFIYFHFRILYDVVESARQKLRKHYIQIFYYFILTEHVKKAREISVIFRKSLNYP